MRNKHKIELAALAAVLFASVSFAQNAGADKHYRLDFTLKEVEGGKVINSRLYSQIFSLGGASQTRAGSKIPYGPNLTNWVDVGVNIDCAHGVESPEGLELNVTAEVSSVPPEFESANQPGLPLVRSNKWSSNVVVPLNKPTLLFSSDIPSSKRKMELELTATLIR